MTGEAWGINERQALGRDDIRGLGQGCDERLGVGTTGEGWSRNDREGLG